MRVMCQLVDVGVLLGYRLVGGRTSRGRGSHWHTGRNVQASVVVSNKI